MQGPTPKFRKRGHSALRVNKGVMESFDPAPEKPDDHTFIHWLEQHARAGSLSTAIDSVLHFTNVIRGRNNEIDLRLAIKEAMQHERRNH